MPRNGVPARLPLALGLLLGLVAVVVAAPGAGAVPTTAEAASAATDGGARASGARTKVRLYRTAFGRIITNGRGRALYLFTKDRKRRSRCYGDCARAWPPFRARGKLIAGWGVKRRLLGATRRRNGKRQVTYRGHPLYYYVGERKPGQVLCQNVFSYGGLWLVVNRRGRAVR